MSPVHLGVGVVVVGLVVAGFAALELDKSPEAQRFVVKNDFADASCRMDFANGATETFSINKGAEHRKTYKFPRAGFVTIRCATAKKILEIPGSFHMRNGELTRLTLKPEGVAEYGYERAS